MALNSSSFNDENVPRMATHPLDIQELVSLKTSGGWAEGSISHTSFPVCGMQIPTDNGLHFLRTFIKSTLDYMQAILNTKNTDCGHNKVGFSYAIVAIFYDDHGLGASKELAFLLKRVRDDWCNKEE